MNIVIMSRQSPGPARPAHTRPRPGPSPMCLNCFQPRPGPGPQYVGPGPARPARLCRGPARPGPRAAGRAGLGPKARPAQGTSAYARHYYASLVIFVRLARLLLARLLGCPYEAHLIHFTTTYCSKD